MNCCICGKPVGQWGNNPFPLCHKDDYESRCCDICNGMVIQARLISSNVDKSKQLNIGDQILIFWSKNSNNPTDVIANSNKFLAGTIESITQENKKILYKGSWGSFVVDNETDQFVKI